MQVGFLAGEIHVDGLPDQDFERIIDAKELHMAQHLVADLVGDGNAKVSVSMNLKDSSFGKGFGTQVTVTLAVHQDEEIIGEAFDLARDLVAEYSVNAFETAKELAEGLISSTK